MPKIIEITIGLATSFNNPFESYSNFNPSVQLKAIVADGEDPNRVALDLQTKAGELLATERHRILDGLKREHDMEAAEREVQYAEARVKSLEEVIAESSRKLADSSWLDHAQGHEVEHVETRLKSANDEIDRVRTELAKAKQNLADLIGL